MAVSPSTLFFTADPSQQNIQKALPPKDTHPYALVVDGRIVCMRRSNGQDVLAVYRTPHGGQSALLACGIEGAMIVPRSEWGF